MFAGVVAATLLASQLPAVATHWPAPLRDQPWLFGCLLALGFVLGELPNSFLKRQLAIAPGARQRSALGVALALFDQADFVPGIWLTLSPLWFMPPAEVAIVFATALLVHLLINVIGYAIGARKSWL
jgi:CDP-diglyceride synthetase